MSAHIVTDKTINIIVSYIRCKRAIDPWFSNKLNDFFLENMPDKTLEDLAQAMLDLNTKAVDVRYKEKNEVERIVYIEYWILNKFQVLKSIDCYLYQCSEGKIPETPLFKFIEYVQLFLLKEIARSNKQYEKAIWD
jgi:hypothetical protein